MKEEMASLNAIQSASPQIQTGSRDYDTYTNSSDGDSFRDMMQTASADSAGTKEYGPKIQKNLKNPQTEEAQQDPAEEENVISAEALALLLGMGSETLPEVLDVQTVVPEVAAEIVQETIPVGTEPSTVQNGTPAEVQQTAVANIPQTAQEYVEQNAVRQAETSGQESIWKNQPEQKNENKTGFVKTETVEVPAGQPVTQQAVQRTDATQTGDQNQGDMAGLPDKAAESIQFEVKSTDDGETGLEADTVDFTRQSVLNQDQPVKNTEVVKVKVAEPYREVNQAAVRQIAHTVQETASAGKQEVVIQLNPEHLGKIAIKITVLEDGIKVALSCDNAKTQTLLAEKAAGIGKIVEENMNTPVTVEVKQDGYWNQQKDAADQQARQQNSQNQQEKEKPENADDFLQQLRLGLVS